MRGGGLHLPCGARRGRQKASKGRGFIAFSCQSWGPRPPGGFRTVYHSYKSYQERENPRMINTDFIVYLDRTMVWGDTCLRATVTILSGVAIFGKSRQSPPLNLSPSSWRRHNVWRRAAGSSLSRAEFLSPLHSKPSLLFLSSRRRECGSSLASSAARQSIKAPRLFDQSWSWSRIRASGW